MVNLFSWIFTLGGIFSYLILFIHSIKGKEREQTSSLFIFIGGFIVALLLEFTLTIILNAYTYQNLPLTIFSIPIVIPLGWVITFYCILELNIDLLQELNQSKNYILLILLIFISSCFFGFSIEVLARNADFWIFHFDSLEIFNIPIIVTLSWGFSVVIFSSSYLVYEKIKKIPIVILICSLVLNIIIGIILLSFVK